MKDYVINLTNMIKCVAEYEQLKITEEDIKAIANIIYDDADLENEINNAIYYAMDDLGIKKLN